MDIDNLDEFIIIDKRIDANEEEAGVLLSEAGVILGETLRDRWEFGKLMLAARGLTKAGRPSKNLPNGFLVKLVEETGKSERELSYRVQFAERYPTEDEFCKALRSLESWTQIIKSLPEARPEKPESPPKTRTRGTGFTGIQEQELIRKVFEENKTKQVAEAEVMGWSEPKQDAGRQMHRLIAAEEARRIGEDEAAPIAWDSIPGNQQVKLERAKKTIRRELEKEFIAKLMALAAEKRAEADAIIAEHKAKLDARAKLERENRDRERARYDMLSKVHSGKGLITPSDYSLIRACLHPDNSASTEKRAEAFRVFNDPRIRALLVKENGAGT